MTDWLHRLHASDPWVPTLLGVLLALALTVLGGYLLKWLDKKE